MKTLCSQSDIEQQTLGITFNLCHHQVLYLFSKLQTVRSSSSGTVLQSYTHISHLTLTFQVGLAPALRSRLFFALCFVFTSRGRGRGRCSPPCFQSFFVWFSSTDKTRCPSQTHDGRRTQNTKKKKHKQTQPTHGRHPQPRL